MSNLQHPLVLRARGFAIWAHGDQKYGDEPYVKHLDDVALLADHFGGDVDMLQAAYLHDVEEDCALVPDAFKAPEVQRHYSRNILSALFGLFVENHVFAVTNELGRNRHERHEKTYPKIRKEGPRAVFLKLCDRIANETASVGTDKAQMYIKEYDGFREALYKPGEHEDLWLTLATTHALLVNAEEVKGSNGAL